MPLDKNCIGWLKVELLSNTTVLPHMKEEITTFIWHVLDENMVSRLIPCVSLHNHLTATS
jgi:hypothetical protein